MLRVRPVENMTTKHNIKQIGIISGLLLQFKGILLSHCRKVTKLTGIWNVSTR